MLGMLQIVLGHDAIAGTLRIACKVHVFLRHMLGGSADFHVGTGAVVGARQRVLAFAIAATVIVIASATSATALVLLSWPHSIVTWLFS